MGMNAYQNKVGIHQGGQMGGQQPGQMGQMAGPNGQLAQLGGGAAGPGGSEWAMQNKQLELMRLKSQNQSIAAQLQPPHQADLVRGSVRLASPERAFHLSPRQLP